MKGLIGLNQPEHISLDHQFSLDELITRDIKSPSLGSNDIYWIDTKIIEALKPKE